LLTSRGLWLARTAPYYTKLIGMIKQTDRDTLDIKDVSEGAGTVDVVCGIGQKWHIGIDVIIALFLNCLAEACNRVCTGCRIKVCKILYCQWPVPGVKIRIKELRAALRFGVAADIWETSGIIDPVQKAGAFDWSDLSHVTNTVTKGQEVINT
jgi:hypothetical protein